VPPGTPVAPATSYKANLSASYEVDLFGRVSSNVAAARGDAGAVEATYRSVLLSLQADVAQTYFRLRATGRRTGDREPDRAPARGERARDQRRFDLGDIGEFDLSRAKTELATRAPRRSACSASAPLPSMRWRCCWASRPRASAAASPLLDAARCR
jgi:multidrug efflux system outer membrane protein